MWVHFIAFFNRYLPFLQADWKLRTLSASYRLKKPDRRFDELKNYCNELQTHINNIIKIRVVSTSFVCFSQKTYRQIIQFTYTQKLYSELNPLDVKLFLPNFCRCQINFQHATAQRRINFRQSSSWRRIILAPGKPCDPPRALMRVTK